MEHNERDRNYSNRGGDNQQVGRELYRKDQERNENRHEPRRASYQEWGEDSYFHTGPSKRGAQDHDRKNSYNSDAPHSNSYNQRQHPSQSEHYGTRSSSAYRNEGSYLNHGDNYNNKNQKNRYGGISGSQPGNYNEPPTQKDNIHREGPGSRSRYKEDDYRYGSGSHNWYRENRYSPDEDRDQRHDDRGFFERMGEGIRDTWNDIMHADDRDYQDRNQRYRAPEKGSDRVRMGSEPYRDRRYDRGYEGGPRWADETDSGRDDYYNDSDRSQRYRR
ncbi:hypothetical protein FVR03_09650 [Pontibacter qinzhouensis]|uniref:Uncharacterized protein n=1 Tax=Pontibacter qinzhouensis TaxID=2603253 RepID=A0A5C8KAV6_9BACT|nr:hypothetical protein [Pontibacter qinzhouensis]TXK47450.1 hypothetical protein FVR03_09650 [Pontibacter qinzhouensis]